MEYLKKKGKKGKKTWITTDWEDNRCQVGGVGGNLYPADDFIHERRSLLYIVRKGP
jgi:hypothetical protein